MTAPNVISTADYKGQFKLGDVSYCFPLTVQDGFSAERPTALSTVEVWALGGAMGRVRPDATAFYHRQAPFLLTIEANAEDPATDEANIAWVRRRYDEATQVSRGGTYFNFGGFWEGGEEMLAQSLGVNYRRVREVKTKYDPGNVFYHNLRIPTGE